MNRLIVPIVLLAVAGPVRAADPVPVLSDGAIEFDSRQFTKVLSAPSALDARFCTTCISFEVGPLNTKRPGAVIIVR